LDKLATNYDKIFQLHLKKVATHINFYQINFYQNRSSIVEVMIKKFWCVFYAPHSAVEDRRWLLHVK